MRELERLVGKMNKTKILLGEDSCYEWIKDNNFYFKGFVQDNDGEVLDEKDVIAYFSGIQSSEELVYALNNISGCFCGIIVNDNSTWLFTDIARTMPLFFDAKVGVVSDIPELIIKESCEKKYDIDYIRAFEMYATEYVCYESTIYRGIHQVLPGSVVIIQDENVKTKPYFRHCGKTNDVSKEAALKKIDVLTAKMVEKLKRYAKDNEIVLSLSGGYDSRYLAFSLKRNGLKNVVLYTYGKKNSFEVLQAEKIAKAIGYRWINIEYTDEDVKDIILDESFYEYKDFADYTVYLQNYVALKKIKENRLVADDSIFISGLCNDMPTGFYIPTADIVRKYGANEEGIKNYIIDRRFVKFEPTNEAREILKKDIEKIIGIYQITIKDYETFISALDILETIGAHVKCYLNMNRVHEYFGYKWYLPCWDKELLRFWYSLPVQFRIRQYLYEEYVTSVIGKEFGIIEKKHLNYTSTSPIKEKVVRKIGAQVAFLCYHVGIPVRRKTDINNYSSLELVLYNLISNKRSIKMERASLSLLNTIYIMEKRYGRTWYDKIQRFINNGKGHSI